MASMIDVPPIRTLCAIALKLRSIVALRVRGPFSLIEQVSQINVLFRLVTTPQVRNPIAQSILLTLSQSV